jgi:YebC/PmpR family DNA-binding regulatory protein
MEVFLMSGHSKWSSIKHKKAAVDAKRGKIFTKLVKEITISAREGGGGLDSNARLRTAVQSAKAQNMPQDNIDRAIKKGTGELPGVNYVEISYEGYGPGGIAIMLDIVTDNKNRTVAEIRNVFTKRNGSLGETGCVGWMFTKKGLITVKKDLVDEETLMNIVLEAGAEDINLEEDLYEIYCQSADFENIKDSILKNNLNFESAEITMEPNNTIEITDVNIAKQLMNLMEELEDHDDVQNVYANFDMDTDLLEN